MMNSYAIFHNRELYHWGIKNQKWGVRRYQNEDGSLTPAGRERYRDDDSGVSTIKRGSDAVNDILSSYGDYSWSSLQKSNSDLLQQTLDDLLKGL